MVTFDVTRNIKTNRFTFMKTILLLLGILPVLAFGQYDIDLELLASDYNFPTEIVNAGDERLFVVEKTGVIKILYTNGTQQDLPFLNIIPQVTTSTFSGDERGLLGLAFPPDYCNSGKFYVNYTFTQNDSLFTRISRFSVNPENENLALENSEESLLEFYQPFGNHNGGQIEFGPDGYLYIAAGDGGSAGDPNNNGQNRMTYLGKLLRIDVSTTPYSIPSDNPFVFDDFGLDEIWAYGLRNPWKFAFDQETGDLFIGDVGQNAIEEVDFQPAGASGGTNYGWRCFEGNQEYNLSQCEDVTGITYPIFEYSHSDGCSITGGRVYRGNSFSNFEGKYIVSDYCSGDYWLLWQENGEWQSYEGGLLASKIVAYGEDVWGEMYAVNTTLGNVYRVTEASGELVDHISFINSNTLESNLAGAEYAWYFNGELIEGENEQTLSVFQNGEYVVVITSETGCEITSNSFQVNTVGISDHESIRIFKVFPNPTSGVINIEVKLDASAYGSLRIQLFSIDGKEVFTFQGEGETPFSEIDLSKLNAGIYFLNCSNAKGEILATRKIVLN